MPPGDKVVLKGAGARVTATPDLLFRAEVSEESLTILFRAGDIPEHLQGRATGWVPGLLAIAGLEIDTHTDSVGSTFTRRSLIDMLKRFRRHVARGRVTNAPRVIEQHLLDAETARLRHERFADRG